MAPHVNPHSAKPRVSWLSNALLMRLLWDGPHTMQELRDETGLAESTIRGYLGALRKQRLVAIVDPLEARNGTRRKHVYQWRPDTRDFKPKPLTGAERTARCRERRRERERHAAMCFIEPRVPAGYTAEELERDNPYNAWLHQA